MNTKKIETEPLIAVSQAKHDLIAVAGTALAVIARDLTGVTRGRVTLNLIATCHHGREPDAIRIEIAAPVPGRLCMINESNTLLDALAALKTSLENTRKL